MSLVSTLGKIAMGVMVAKGVGKMMGNNSGGASSGGLGGLLGSALGGQQGGGSGGLGGLLGSALGGQQGGSGGLGGLLGSVLGGQQGGGGAGGMLGSLLGGGQGGQSDQGGLAGQLGGLLGGGGQQSGGLGGLLDSLGGGAAAGGAAGGLGGLLNQALSGQEPEVNQDAEKQAEILLRAMLSAAKADGEIDAGEREKLTQHLGDVSPEEAAFIQQEMARPVDVEGLVASVPQGMEQQVYLMSLTAIDLDSQAEAQYLHQLAQGLGIDQQACNTIHQQLGVPVLYS